MKIRPGVLSVAAVFTLFSAGIAAAPDVQTNVIYVCNGERIFVENCNMRDLSDTATCMVGHPDTILSNGLMKYTYETRGALKQLLPTCKQPSPEEVARAQARAKKVQDTQDAIQKKNLAMMDAPPPAAPAPTAKQTQLKEDQRALRRCVSSGRTPAVCMGNTLSKPFDALLGQLLPSVAGPIPPGPNMNGAFDGKDFWRVEFDDRSVMLKCAGMVPDQHSYSIVMKNNQAVITIESTPKPIVLAMKQDGTLVGTGPVVVDGHVPGGHGGGGGSVGGQAGGYTTEAKTTQTEMTPMEAEAYQRGGGTGLTQNGQTYTATQTETVTTFHNAPPPAAPQVHYVPVTRTCSQAILSSKGAGATALNQMEGMATMLFNGGDKGPPTPPGIRMHGIYASETGLSVEFYPESAVVGCGLEAARAYPYTVQTSGGQMAIKIEDPARPLVLASKPDGTLDPGSGSYEVQGRSITGQNNDGDFTFAPLNVSCNLGVLKPGAKLSAAPATTTATAASSPTATSAKPAGPAYATLSVPTGKAVLSIASGLPAQANAPNPLAGRPYILLRDNFATTLSKGGAQVPAGVTPHKAVADACANRTPDCQKYLQAISANSAAGLKADANGKMTLPGVPAGTYYLMVTGQYNNQSIFWDMKVELKEGANSVTLDQKNAEVLK
jgi:hypothetical protein